MDDYYVGPNLLRSQLPRRLTLDMKIDLYERRIGGWFINIAKSLKRDPSDPQEGPGADFVSLMIAMSLFEAHGILLQGKRTPLQSKKNKRTGKVKQEPVSRKNFEAGFSRFLSAKYPTLPATRHSEIAEMIYEQVRCGLYHAGMTKKGITLYRGPDEEHPTPPIGPEFSRKRLVAISFNVPAFILEVEDYFKAYLADTRIRKNPLRKSFAEGWTIINNNLKLT